ncbi:hypothetical protein N9Y92_01675 [Chlamydiales bacterium]|nr:hypothetical protein [Chlamydiales bacterium]
MNKKNIIVSLTLAIAATTSLMAIPLTQDITHEIPEISDTSFDGYEKIKDVAQYKNADWNNVIGISKHISIQEAKKIADNDPDITFFFLTKGHRMVLEKEDGTYRTFHHGDAVFFTGEPWWGSAPGLADGYIKQ